jgi:hypothetical protein
VTRGDPVGHTPTLLAPLQRVPDCGDASGVGGGWRDWAAAGVLLAAVALLFLPALAQPQLLLYPTFSPHSDLTVIHWPKVQLMAHTWQTTGELPLWTPANLSGMPLAANQLAMRFYPPAWLLLPLAGAGGAGYSLFFGLHLWWAALGVYWLLRRGCGTGLLPALIGGLAFALSGKLLAHMAGGHVSLVAAVSWLPWAFGGLWQLLDTRLATGARWRWALLTGLALAMQVTTHSLLVIYTAYLLAGYTVWEVIADLRAGRRPAWSLLALLAAIPLIAVASSAAQLAPLLELAAYSNRALTLTEAGLFALTPLSLVAGLLLPTSQGGHEAIIYVGLAPLVLAALGLFDAPPTGVPRRRAWFLAVVVGVAAVYALGTTTPLFALAHAYLPGLGWVRTPPRAVFVVALAVALLAGLGAQRLARGGVAWPNRAALAAGAVTALAGLGLAVLYAPNRATLGLALLPASGLIVAGLAARRGRPAPHWALPLLAGLVCLDLLSFGATLIRFETPADAFAAGREVAAGLSREPGLFRTYSPSYSLPAHVAAQAGLQTADGVEPVHLERYDRFMALAGGYGALLGENAGRFEVTVPPFPMDQPLETAWRDAEPDARLLGLLNVEYIAAAFPVSAPGIEPLAPVGGTWLYRNTHALPRAWVLPEAAAAPFLTAEAGSDWPEQLYALAAMSAAGAGAATASAVVQDYQADRIVIAARLTEAGVLVLSENWYPGWQADVGGATLPVVPVAGLLRGVVLPAGEHTVVVAYRPAWAPIAMVMSALAGLGLLVGGAAQARPAPAGP